MRVKFKKPRRATISNSNSIRINQQITADKLRVIGQDGQQLGIMSLVEALGVAEKSGVDLIEISPNADPPVAKVIDWGKYQYQRMKEQQKNRKKSKVVETKQIRLGLKIGSNDLDIKMRKVREFISEGDKVRITIMFRGREMAHQEIGYNLLDKIVEGLSDMAIIEQKPQIAGRNLSIVLRGANK